MAKVISTKAERQALLEIAEQAQHEFWVALRNLELAYGEDAEIDGTQELGAGESYLRELDDTMRDAGFHVVDAAGIGE